MSERSIPRRRVVDVPVVVVEPLVRVPPSASAQRLARVIVGRAALRVALGLLFGGVLGASARAGEEGPVIEFFTSSFLPQTARVEVGQSVRFVWRRGVHRIVSGTGPEDPERGQIFDAVLDESDPEVIFEVSRPYPEGIPFFDAEHPSQQGFLEVTAGEARFRVGVVDNVFLPEDVLVFTGDTVRWEHEFMEGFHTVTSGLGAADPEAGALFDEDSSDDDPVFDYAFSAPGLYPYFCRPHEFLGMLGRVWVQELFVRGDTTGDGNVEITDAIASLNYLFLGGSRRACADALDANDDGAIDIGDAVFTLNHLFLGSADIPPPYPRAGADRSDDRLFCLPEGLEGPELEE